MGGELAHTFCFWKPYKHTRKMAKVLSFQTIPHLYWKNDKGVKPANGFQPAFSGHSVYRISTLGCHDGALRMARGYCSSCAYSGY